MRRIFLFFLFSTSVFSQIQIGLDINGEVAGDQAGFRLSLSGNGIVVAVGANASDGTAGHVRVFEYSNNSWNQLGSNIVGEATGDFSGESVSISHNGTIVAIGAPGNDGNGSGSGHVKVFEYSNNSWSQLGSNIDGEATGDSSGISISLSSDGTKVAVGAPSNDGNGFNAGHVKVFEYSNNSWNQLGLSIVGEAVGDLSGLNVSLSSDGTKVAVGAPLNNGNGSNSGNVRVFEYSNNSWNQLGSNIVGEAAYDSSGQSVSINHDGTIVAIGAPGNNGNGSDSGHVKVFKYSNNSWSQLGSNIIGEAPGDISGFSVSLSSDGTKVAVGAPLNNGNGSFNGHTRVFEYSNSSWSQIGSEINGKAVADLSGYSVSLSSNGRTKVAVGAPLNNENTGNAKVFEFNATPTDISLSSMSVDENVTIGTTLGSFLTTDSDSGDTHTYSLVSGIGDIDNSSFIVSGANLLTNTSIDYETKTSYSIRIQTSDGTDTYSKSFTISVNDINEDIDNDGINNDIDNCPAVANIDQIDTDSDGKGDVCEDDDDNDGFLDTNDAFPLDSSEWLDTDSDGVGNNADTDDDNDNYSDADEIGCQSDPLDSGSLPPDNDNDLLTDCIDPDDDNDTYLDSNDAFPLDPTEWLDTDSDGVGNNTDTDDDNDMYLDTDEVSCQSDPLDSNSLPLDNDNDLSPDCLDLDDDNDNYLDTEDLFPFDSLEWADNDSDGIGNNADTDDDNDTYPDVIDFFPFDPSEWSDTDLDGTGNNADTDDDNDGFSDSDEISCNTNYLDSLSFPLDSDGDTIADCIDEDSDGDGFKDDQILISGVLTPRSNGLESTWKIVNAERFNHEIQVYSSDGILVFKSYNYKNDWKGVNINGEALPSGPYYYVVTIRGVKTEVKKGWLYIFN